MDEKSKQQGTSGDKVSMYSRLPDAPMDYGIIGKSYFSRLRRKALHRQISLAGALRFLLFGYD
ncbi:hypothetical protein FOVG_07142 [Fusarium oxysporum f. sp. pisi HDV247]|uniref:Uncharacterized protein n=1 Tax=Fusarium oxysporum f. sp. pisi HDV247 TaxID=1080344 RepID=W9PVX5_FUSOX|nr:hypothetical protein FOVG_07142 [Fusarium oxysporum f. sp. pisi HDV247]